MSSLIELLQDRIAQRGDLPIFRRSVAQVLRLGEDAGSKASDYARVILEDQGLAIKVLNLSNSFYYNRSGESIKTVSRSVVLLGVDMITGICLSLGFVELFQRDNPEIALKQILARAYYSAILARELAGEAKHPHPEEVFLAGLLQYLGTVAVAYYLPEEYLKIRDELKKTGMPGSKIECRVLGHSYDQIGAALARNWALPDGLIEMISDSLQTDEKNREEYQTWFFSSLSKKVSESLFTEPGQSQDLEKYLEELCEELDCDLNDLLELIETAHMKARELAGSLGIDTKCLRVDASTPESMEAGPLRDRIAGLLAAESESYPVPSAVDLLQEYETDPAGLQLALLREISQHIFENRDISNLFNLVMEGIQRVVGFERIFLALCNRDRSCIQGRYGFGASANELAEQIDVRLDSENIFSLCLKNKKAALIRDIEAEPFSSLVPPPLREVLKADSFVVSPIYSIDQLVGFFYADNAVSNKPITVDDFRCFEHFTLQANLGLDRIRLMGAG